MGNLKEITDTLFDKYSHQDYNGVNVITETQYDYLVEELIVKLNSPVVVRQSEQLKDIQTLTFEEYIDRFYDVYQGNNYKDKKTGTSISFNDLKKEYNLFIISL